MADGNDDLLRFQVEDLKDEVSAQGFLEAFARTLSALASLSRDFSDYGVENVEWRIVSLAKNSPASAILHGYSTSPQNGEAGVRIIHALLGGIHSLERTDEAPNRFSERTLKDIADLANVFPRGISGITYDRVSPRGFQVKETAKVTREVIKNAKAAQKKKEYERTRKSGQYRDYGSLEGRLRDLLGSSDQIVLIDELTGAPIKCTFEARLDSTVRQAWKRRVAVTGEITYERQTGNALSVEVEEIRILRERADLPQIGDFRGIDITGGVESSDYVRNLRDG